MRHPVPSGPAPGRGARRLLLAGVLLTVLTVVTGGPVGALALAVALTAILAAVVVMMRAHWVAAGNDGPPPSAAPAAPPAAVPVDVPAALRRLRAEHIAAVDAALDEGRHDLARALVVAHQDEVRRMLTDGAARPVG